MNKTLAKIVSIVFNPLIMPTYGLLILFSANTYFSLLPFEAKKAIFLTIFISTCLLPLAFIPLFMYQKLINNIDMEDKKERLIPYSVIAVLYFLSYFMMEQMGVPETILKVILAAGLLLVTIILITLKWKISTHMAGIGGLAATLITFSLILKANFLVFLIITLIAAGMLGTARITLKLHSPLQIYAGFSLGALMIALTFLVF